VFTVVFLLFENQLQCWNPHISETETVTVCRSVCLSVTTVSCVEAAEPIETLFVIWTRVSPVGCVGWGSRFPYGNGHF